MVPLADCRRAHSSLPPYISEILYTNNRVKSLDESCYGYRRSRGALAPGFLYKAKGKWKRRWKTVEEPEIRVGRHASVQKSREKKDPGFWGLIAKVGE